MEVSNLVVFIRYKNMLLLCKFVVLSTQKTAKIMKKDLALLCRSVSVILGAVLVVCNASHVVLMHNFHCVIFYNSILTLTSCVRSTMASFPSLTFNFACFVC